MFDELMKKKKKGLDMEPKEKEARMGVLKDIKKLATDSMGEDVKGLKKVSVMSDSKEGLKAGLEKAGDVVEEIADGREGEESGDEDNMLDADVKEDKPEDMKDELSDMSDEELDRLMELIQARKSKKD